MTLPPGRPPCGHAAPVPDVCRWCRRVLASPRHRALWFPAAGAAAPAADAPAVTPARRRPRDPNKPRLSIAQMADRKRH